MDGLLPHSGGARPLSENTLRASRSADAFYSLAKKPYPRQLFAPPPALCAEEPSLGRLTSACTLRVHFTTSKETQWGDQVRLVGSSEQLGAWDPARTSVILSTDKSTYPSWGATVELALPADAALLEYKLVIIKAKTQAEIKKGVSHVEWEPLAENRRVAPHARHSAKAAHVALSWGEPGASIRWRWEW